MDVGHIIPLMTKILDSLRKFLNARFSYFVLKLVFYHFQSPKSKATMPLGLLFRSS